jgi:hypothetical protein
MIELDDWAAHLMRAEVQLKALEKHLLNKNYNDVQAHATAAKHYIDKTMAWVARQGSSKGVDVVQILQSNLPSMTDSDPPQIASDRLHSGDRAIEVGAAVLAEVRL